ncbi:MULTISPECIES: DNA repair protein RecO [Thiomicrorhabdus]|uniref:DNA repair protein RecO n=1 Tax=Thiomicrorhabdus heinhorstiae TaxID=2748010 RepID=A0ABS0BXU6_9GAMM|nr:MULTISPECIES: DNA repair protein RecO [Thiomicrorhabdus]MBF6057923.1 DNA repair protein RecO [Thiomicrorhabdus heinhorstiae]
MLVQAEAFVLHSRPYKETSALVTFFSAEQGKFNAVVRGVRGGKSAYHKNALLQMFQPLNLSWKARNNHSDLVSLQQFESAGRSYALQGEANLCGLYLNELLYRSLYPHLAAETLFDTYKQTLEALQLAEDRRHQGWVLRRFETDLLCEMGEELVYLEDASHQPILEEQIYYYLPQMGPVPAQQLEQTGGAAIMGKCLLSLGEGRYCDECLAQWRDLMRLLLNPYLGDKPIMARQLFRRQSQNKQNKS